MMMMQIANCVKQMYSDKNPPRCNTLCGPSRVSRPFQEEYLSQSAAVHEVHYSWYIGIYWSDRRLARKVLKN